MRYLLLLLILSVSTTIIFSQNVGIGTTDPDATLEISNNSTFFIPQLHLNEIGNDYARIKFDNTISSNFWSLQGYNASNSNNDVFSFHNGDTGDLLVLKGNGRLGLKVGISPKTTFHVGENERVLFGKDTLGSGFKFMFLADLEAFRVGKLNPGAASTYWNRDSIGLNSFAAGINTRAQGTGATAFGRDTEATSSYTFATGFFSNADGIYSTAMGYNTDAFGATSTALGYSSDALGENSVAAGYFCISKGTGSTAFGEHTIAEAAISTAIGRYNIGGGASNTWISSDPIFEIGIGSGDNNRQNALTVLKNGKHGILTDDPKASLHVKEDGIEDEGTIVAVIESDVSNRPILQFSETPLGTPGSGMSIEYDGRDSGPDNKMYINNSSGNPIITFENGGQVGIGLTSPTFKLQLPQNSSTGVARAFSWTTYSDQRIKSDVSNLHYGLSEILMLKPVIYKQHSSEFKNNQLEISDDFVLTMGFLAQDVHKIIPEAVNEPDNDMEELWGMDYEKLIPVLVNGMQEQQNEIEHLKKEIELLKSLILKNQDESELTNKIVVVANK